MKDAEKVSRMLELFHLRDRLVGLKATDVGFKIEDQGRIDSALMNVNEEIRELIRDYAFISTLK